MKEKLLVKDNLTLGIGIVVTKVYDTKGLKEVRAYFKKLDKVLEFMADEIGFVDDQDN